MITPSLSVIDYLTQHFFFHAVLSSLSLQEISDTSGYSEIILIMLTNSASSFFSGFCYFYYCDCWYDQ